MPPIVFEVITRVSADDQVAFDKLTEEMNAAASGVGRASSIDVTAVEPKQADIAARKISVAFANDADLASWLASPEHARFVTRLGTMLVDRYETQVRTGMESWGFQPPAFVRQNAGSQLSLHLSGCFLC